LFVDSKKDLIIIGDRVLIQPDTDKTRTESGLYLPQGVTEKEKVQGGLVVKTGPGYVMPHQSESGEPWLEAKNEPRYIPLQVAEGDYAIFLRKEAIEIEYEGRKYLIIHQGGILAVVRDSSLP
jgi:chaperonin GroES